MTIVSTLPSTAKKATRQQTRISWKERIARSKLLRPLVWYWAVKRGKRMSTTNGQDDHAGADKDVQVMGVECHPVMGVVSGEELLVYTFDDADPNLRDPVNDDDIDNDSQSMPVRCSWRERLGRSWRQMLKKKNRKPLSSFDHEASLTSTDDELDVANGVADYDDATIFSTSTDRLASLPIITPRTLVKCLLYNKSTCSSDDDDDDHADDDADDAKQVQKKASYSLDQYLAKQTMIHLSDVSQDDAVSLGCACLAVSFEDDYPQLVLQTSSTIGDKDDTENDSEHGDDCSLSFHPYAAVMTSHQNQQRDAKDDEKDSSTHRLGILFPHPAQREALVSSCLFWKKRGEKHERRRNTKSYTRAYLNEEQIWERIGGIGNTDVDDDDDDTVPLFSDICSVDAMPSPVPIESKHTNWDIEEDEELRWTFSKEDSVVSFTSVLGSEIFHAPVAVRFDQIPTPTCSGTTVDREPKAKYHDRPYDELDY